MSNEEVNGTKKIKITILNNNMRIILKHLTIFYNNKFIISYYNVIII